MQNFIRRITYFHFYQENPTNQVKFIREYESKKEMSALFYFHVKVGNNRTKQMSIRKRKRKNASNNVIKSIYKSELNEC